MSSSVFAPEAAVQHGLKTLAQWVERFQSAGLPARTATVARIRACAGDPEAVEARALAAIVEADPLMTLRVFSHLARQRNAHAAAEVTTIERAVLMLGIPPFLAAFANTSTVEESLADRPVALAALDRVIARGEHAAELAARFAAWRNDAAVQELMLAARLHDLAEMLLWCHDPAAAERIASLLAADTSLRSADAQRRVLGIALLDLQHELVIAWRLPQLLVRMMDDRHAEQTRVLNVKLAVDIARHSAQGWDNAALPDDIAAVARFLRTTPRQVRDMIEAPETDLESA